MSKFFEIVNLINVANAFKLVFRNALKINLAGLEPTYWKEDNLDIVDLILELRHNQHQVEMTTNGSNLLLFKSRLLSSGLSKCRISIHSFNPEIYERITGFNSLSQVLQVTRELNSAGINVVINRVLLKNFTDDIPLALDFVIKEKLKIKFYDLWWTKQIQNAYSNYYIHWENILDQYVKERSSHTEISHSKYHRKRETFFLDGGGIVEVKHFDNEMHNNCGICKKCDFKFKCKESFGSYIHIFSSGVITFCNLREDINIDIKPLLDSNSSVLELSEFIESNIKRIFGKEWESRLNQASIGFYINENCNYRCSFPDIKKDKNSIWCLSSVRSNSYLINNLSLLQLKNLFYNNSPGMCFR